MARRKRSGSYFQNNITHEQWSANRSSYQNRDTAPSTSPGDRYQDIQPTNHRPELSVFAMPLRQDFGVCGGSQSMEDSISEVLAASRQLKRDKRQYSSPSLSSGTRRRNTRRKPGLIKTHILHLQATQKSWPLYLIFCQTYVVSLRSGGELLVFSA